MKKNKMNEIQRCAWCKNDPLYIKYHDEEWGVPVTDDFKLFEFLILETFQAGLSWITILRKRENFRKAFSNFDFEKVSKYTDKDIERLMNNDGIIRNRLKISAAVVNAVTFCKIRKEFGTFSNYIWAYVDGKTIHSGIKSSTDIPVLTQLSEAISKDLKKRGFKFVGPTIVYSFLQACGLINDHVEGCFRY
jgi:DNA-3-methyladenine glycosylase I